jgi:uncharacterized protein (TIGR00251 family)
LTPDSIPHNALLLRETAQGIIFSVQVVPRSSQNALVGVVNGVLKMKVTAPPVEGKANDECLNLLSASLNISKNRLSIIAGKQSRKKTILLAGVEKKDWKQAIARHFHPLVVAPAD